MERKFRRTFFEEKLLRETIPFTNSNADFRSSCNGENFLEEEEKVRENGYPKIYCSSVIYESLLITPFLITHFVIFVYLKSHDDIFYPIKSNVFQIYSCSALSVEIFLIIFAILILIFRILLSFLSFSEMQSATVHCDAFSRNWLWQKLNKLVHSYVGYHFYTSFILTFSLFVSVYNNFLLILPPNDEISTVMFLQNFCSCLFLLNIFYALIFTRAMALTKFLVCFCFLVNNCAVSVIYGTDTSFNQAIENNSSSSHATKSLSEKASQPALIQ